MPFESITIHYKKSALRLCEAYRLLLYMEIEYPS